MALLSDLCRVLGLPRVPAVSRINGESTTGLDYGAVLDMVIHADRPITLHFARNAKAEQADDVPDAPAARIAHTEWKSAAGQEQGGDTSATPTDTSALHSTEREGGCDAVTICDDIS